MKKETGNKLRLGIFVSISAVLFILGIYFVGERQQLFSDTFHISGVFKNISGLQIGNNVQFSGINVGVIDDIEQTSDTTVRVIMMINKETQKFIKKNANVIISSDGLMGNKIAVITPGTPGQKTIEDNDVIKTSQPVTMDEIMAKLKVTVDNAAGITSDLSIVMKNISEGKGTIGKLIMDTTLARNVDQALVNIKQGAGGFKQNMNAASHNILLKGYFKNKKDKKENKEEEKAEKK